MVKKYYKICWRNILREEFVQGKGKIYSLFRIKSEEV